MVVSITVVKQLLLSCLHHWCVVSLDSCSSRRWYGTYIVHVYNVHVWAIEISTQCVHLDIKLHVMYNQPAASLHD